MSDISIQCPIQYLTSDKGWARKRARARARARAGISDIGNIYRMLDIDIGCQIFGSDIDFGNIGVILLNGAS